MKDLVIKSGDFTFENKDTDANLWNMLKVK